MRNGHVLPVAIADEPDPQEEAPTSKIRFVPIVFIGLMMYGATSLDQRTSEELLRSPYTYRICEQIRRHGNFSNNATCDDIYYNCFIDSARSKIDQDGNLKDYGNLELCMGSAAWSYREIFHGTGNDASKCAAVAHLASVLYRMVRSKDALAGSLGRDAVHEAKQVLVIWESPACQRLRDERLTSASGTASGLTQTWPPLQQDSSPQMITSAHTPRVMPLPCARACYSYCAASDIIHSDCPRCLDQERRPPSSVCKMRVSSFFAPPGCAACSGVMLQTHTYCPALPRCTKAFLGAEVLRNALRAGAHEEGVGELGTVLTQHEQQQFRLAEAVVDARGGSGSSGAEENGDKGEM
jgi:hypothetical protein